MFVYVCGTFLLCIFAMQCYAFPLFMASNFLIYVESWTVQGENFDAGGTVP